MSAHAICEQYLTCLSNTSPTELAIAVAAYGEGGSCWKAGSEALCATACLTGLEMHHDSNPQHCPECFGSEHCVGTERCIEGTCAREHCVIESADSACESCVKTECCDELSACMADMACRCLAECVQAMGFNPTVVADCAGQCGVDLANPPPGAMALYFCGEEYCLGECGGL